MNNQPAYRLSLSAADIEKLLLSIDEKLTATNVIHDYTLGGGAKDIAAAEAVKQMWLKLNTMVVGEGLKDAINDADDSHVFSDYYKSVLDRESWKFIGSPADILERDDIDTSGFIGGEVVLLQKNLAGNPEFQYWKRTPVAGEDPIFAWESVYAGSSNDAEIEFPIQGTKLLKNVPKTLFHMIEFRIHAYDKPLGHWQSVDGKLGFRGDDLIISIYNEVETKRLVEYSFTQDADNMVINIVTLQPDMRCNLSMIAGY